MQECTRIFNECLEGKHQLLRYKNSDSFVIGDTKVNFYHMAGSRIFNVYYGSMVSESMHIDDPTLRTLATRVYSAAEAALAKKQRELDCKKMEELLRS